MSILSYPSGVPKSHDLSKWIGGSEGQGLSLSQVPQPIDVNQLQVFLSLCNYY
jgi:hypothetical protein